jgi:hypothetical protein
MHTNSSFSEKPKLIARIKQYKHSYDGRRGWSRASAGHRILYSVLDMYPALSVRLLFPKNIGGDGDDNGRRRNQCCGDGQVLFFQHLILLSLTSYPGTRPQTIPSQHSLSPLFSRPTPPKNSMCHGHPSHPRAQTQKNTNSQTGLPNGRTAAAWQNALGCPLLA